jgi:hypothetical protein
MRSMLTEYQIRKETGSPDTLFHCCLLLFWDSDGKRYSNCLDHEIFCRIVWVSTSHEYWWRSRRYLVSFAERHSYCWICICRGWWSNAWVSEPLHQSSFLILTAMQTNCRRGHRVKLFEMAIDRICMLHPCSVFYPILIIFTAHRNHDVVFPPLGCFNPR